LSALENGEIDIYPEYSGTISEQILKSDQNLSIGELRDSVGHRFNLNISRPYGFNNTYALAVRQQTSRTLNLQTISDLRKHPDLNFAFSYEFLKRSDGWENLAAVYGLIQRPVGIEHGLSYQAISEGKIDCIDIYSTDGEIPRYDLVILEDDQRFFPNYFAVSFFRNQLDPEIIKLISVLDGRFTESSMQELNAKVVFAGESYAKVAMDFLTENGLVSSDSRHQQISILSEIGEKTIIHLQITFIALFAAMLIAIPLGIIVYNYKVIARPILYVSGLLQTIPSIALLAIMIPLFGIGLIPAIVALFLYALLPILRNTASALFSIDPLFKKIAIGIGLTRWQQLRHIEIPLSVPTIFAGIKTAAVINIGTATLAAFIGAGGLGEFIVTGLALNNTTLILKGAIPAAVLAIIVEFIFELLERWLVPHHLQQKVGT
jgi:osmoprotectant transport system permease protein